MATLTINGKQVTVSDDFLKLSPQQQEATVNEIAAQMAQQAGPTAKTVTPNAPETPGAFGKPGSREYADWAAAQARAKQKLPQVSPQPPEWGQAGTGPMDQFQAGYTSAVNAVPIAGPSLLNAVEGAKAGIWNVPQSQIAAEDRALEQANPTASTVGAVTGTVLPYALGATIPGVSQVLGMGPVTGIGSLAANTAASGISSAVIGGADSMARGSSPQQAAQDALISGGLGLALPGLGAAAGKGLQVAGKGLKIAGQGADWALGHAPSTLMRLKNPARAGQMIAGETLSAKSVGSDIQRGTALSPALEQFAQQSGQPIVNMDRGGTITRNLARSASNVSQEADSMLKAATDRGATAGARVSDYLTKLVGGSANDVQFREGLQSAARLANNPAYKKAFSSPAAQSIWSQDLANMFQASEFVDAVKAVEGVGRLRAAGAGAEAVRNPFVLKDGKVYLKQGVTPTLEFWDKVKIGLDRQIEAAYGAGKKSYGVDLTNLKNRLVNALDAAVPEYKQARAGAALFFGAENALDAGRNFGARLGQVPEAEAAFAKFSDAEKKAFAVGWVSSITDKLGSRDGYGVVKQVLENQNTRKMAEMALGPAKAAQLESFLRVEAIMSLGNDAVRGGSTTARQWAMMAGVSGGIGGAGAAYGFGTGDWKPLTFATLLGGGRVGLQYLGRSVDQKVMEEVARLLSTNDKAALNKVIANASMSPRWKQALNAIFIGMGASAHAGAVTAPQMMAQ